MIQSETPKIVKKKLFSPIWLLPAVAFLLGIWLLVKGIKDAGTEVKIHFPNATGIEIGKTLVKYQGVNVGKVKDIEIDGSLQGVIVTVNMNYRGEPFLNENSQFWLVSPKASITKIEGLDTLFSGNYIAIKPGDGVRKLKFEASLEAPPIMPASEGMLITLYAKKLGSIDIGSHIFYRQIPVGNVVSFRLDKSDQVAISVFVEKQYAYLIKKNSHFWNTSGVKVDASLSGIKINAESLASIIAGGISFDSPSNSKQTNSGATYTLFDTEEEAVGGLNIKLISNSADSINIGTSIEYRGLTMGNVTKTELKNGKIEIEAQIYHRFTHLLSDTSKFWTEGAQIGLDGIKHASRLVTGAVISFLPGQGKSSSAEREYTLLTDEPDEAKAPSFKFSINSNENFGLKDGSAITYRNIKIGKVNEVSLAKDLSHVNYSAEVKPEFRNLINKASYFIPQPALNISANLKGVSVKTGDLASALNGSIELIGKKSNRENSLTSSLQLYQSIDNASESFIESNSMSYRLVSAESYGLEKGSPIFYKKMRIGQIRSVKWLSDTDTFEINLGINKQFQSLVNTKAVFWRNQAARIDAGLHGIKVDVAPISGLLQSSISLGLLKTTPATSNHTLYDSSELAIAQAKPITIDFSAKSNLKANAPISYQGFEVGKITNVRLNKDLESITATGYLKSQYAQAFSRSDSTYSLVNAEISLAGIKAPEAILTGPYISVTPGSNEKASNRFIGKLSKMPFTDAPKDAYRITLVKNTLGSITKGTHIFFRGIPVGQVETYHLNQHGDKVKIEAYINRKFAKYVNQSSQFWERSGIKVDAGIFSGLQIDTGSLENILVGGIAVVTEDKTTSSNHLEPKDTFTLHSEEKSGWSDWAPQQ
ncbi:MCE family protein [Shewanella sp. OPT22]|nr:MCE family protein [Shewanella sp. OPT22]